MTTASIDEMAGIFRTAEPHATAQGEQPTAANWKIESASVLDVFDGAAMYDRSRLARLVGGKSVRVARGPVTRDRVVVAAVLLVSPYPEADLRRMNAGTLVMTVELTPSH